MDNIIQSCLNIPTCTCIFFHQRLGFIGCCTLFDEVTEGCRVFLFLPTSGQLPAGFTQTTKSSRLPVASVITPPIRIKSEEEYQWVKTVRTTKLPHQHGHDLYVRGQSLIMSVEPIPKDETTHGRWNITAIPYKYNYTLFSWGRWARQNTPVRRKLDVKLNLIDKTIFLSHLLCTDFSF